MFYSRFWTRYGDRLLFTKNCAGLRESQGEQPDCPSLRALRKHILIVRPQRARRTVGLFPFHSFSPQEWHPCWSYCGRRARLQMIPPSSLVISSGMGADRSSTARVQRGPSEAARCASKEDHQASIPLPFREQGIGTGVIPLLIQGSEWPIVRDASPARRWLRR
jgi:hypothetical protein